MPELVGVSSENAAHRVAVLWEENESIREGVFISRRDTNSQLNVLLGGRMFPGEHHLASFSVQETDAAVNIEMKSVDEAVTVEIKGNIGEELPSSSIFSSLADASSFFEGGSLGYSVTSDQNRLDGLKLETKDWRVEPLDVVRVNSSYFLDEARFPKNSVEFDHALIMRNVAHLWHSAEDLYL